MDSCADSLSTLPQDAISVILSFLPAKSLGRTAVLSKEWAHMFRFSDDIVIDASPDLTNIPVGFHRHRRSCHLRRFLFSILLQRDELNPLRFLPRPFPIHRFSLCYSDPDSMIPIRHIRSFIRISVRLTVKVLDINLSLKHPLFCRLPLLLFNSNSLTNLNLSGKFLIDLEDNIPIRMSNLGVVRLSDVHFKNGKSFTAFFHACSAVKKVSLVGCIIEGTNEVQLVSHSLLHLVLSNFNYRVALITPRINFLEYIGTGHEMIAEERTRPFQDILPPIFQGSEDMAYIWWIFR